MSGKNARNEVGPHRRAMVTAAVVAAVAISVTAGTAAFGAGPAAFDAGTGRSQAEISAGRSATEVRAGRSVAVAADRAVAAGVPGIVARVNDGRGPVIEVARQAGWSVPDHRLRVSDRFQMGSNTKTLTAILVLQLVGEHRLSLEDPIEKWLPGLVPQGQKITVRMLLQHTSGLADFAHEPKVLGLLTGTDTDYPTPRELLALGTAQPLKFAPGRGWSYSNPGYVALGMVLEKITRQPLADLVQQRIARPLGLKDTALPRQNAPHPVTARLAHGYEPDAAHLAPLLPEGTPAGFGFVGPVRGERIDVTAINPNWYGSAGSIVSSPADWARIDRALMRGRLVPPAQLQQMMRVVPEDVDDPDFGPDRRYGLGLEEVHTPCGTVWGHDGALPGYNSDNYTDRTGTRTASVISTTLFGLKTDPTAGTARDAVVTAAVCTMLGRPVPAS